MALYNAKDHIPVVDANGGILKIDQIELVERSSAPTDSDLTDGRFFHKTGTGFQSYEGGTWVNIGGAGSQGAQGDTGAQGADGTQGVAGSQGNQGDTGAGGSTNYLASPFNLEGGTYDPITTITSQTSSAAALTIPDLAGVAQEWVFSKEAQTLENKTLTEPKFVDTGFIADSNGNELLMFGVTSSATTYLKLTNNTNGNGVTLETLGGSSDEDFLLVAKGTGVVKADGAQVATISGTETLTNKTLTLPKIATTGAIVDGGGDEYLVFIESGTPVDYVQITSGDTGTPGSVEIASAGSDGDIDLLLVAKGSGVVKADGVQVSTITGSETLTNKTLTTPTLTTPTLNGVIGKYVVKSAGYTLTATDFCVDVTGASGSVTITLPAASGIAGTVYVIKRSDATYDVVIDGNASEEIDGNTTVTLSSQYQFKMIQSDGTDWIVIASG